VNCKDFQGKNSKYFSF